jgi:hypothetical protein
LLLRTFEPCPKQGNRVLTDHLVTIAARQRAT